MKKTLMSGKFYSMLLGGTLSMVVVSVLLMSDTFIAGLFIGPDAVAGITLVTPLYWLSAFFGSIFSIGIPVVYSEEMGKFNKDRADKAFGLGVLMSLTVGAALFLIVCLFGDAYLRSGNPPETVLTEARGYLFYTRFTILLLPMQMLITEAVYSDGDEGLSTIANGVQGCGNIIASILLSRVMGIRGVALASFLFNAASVLILFIHFLKKSNSLKLNLYFSMDILKTVTSWSIIDASAYLFSSIQVAVLNVFVSNHFGMDYLILVSVITLFRELYLVFDGIGEAITPIIGIYLGEESYIGVRNTYRTAERTAVIEGIVVSLFLFIFAHFVPLVLNIADSSLIGIVITETRILAFGSCFVSLLYLISSYYLLIDRISLGLFVSAMRDVLLSLPLSLLLGKIFGMYGLFIGMAISPAVSYALVLIYVAWRYGRENCPIFLEALKGDVRSEIFNIRTEPEEIIGLQHEAEQLLLNENIDNRTVGRVKLLIEELYMLIREKNGGKAVLSECSVFIKPGGVQVITKDDGVLFDISEEDVNATSLTAFAVSGYMEKLGQDKRYLTTVSFNRSSFLIKYDA